MLTAFAVSPEKQPQVVQTVDDLKELLTAEPQKATWVDIEEPDELQLSALKSLFALDDEPLDDCLHGEQRSRIDEYDGYLFLVLYGMIGFDDATELAPRKLAVFCGPHFLITVHREPIYTIARLRDRFPRHGSQLISQGVDFLLYTIIDGVVDNYLLAAGRLEERIEQLEDKSLSLEIDDEVLAEAADTRRELLRLRHLATAFGDFLLPLTKGENDFLSEELGQRLQHVRDHLAQVVNSVDMQRELLGGVHANYYAVLAQKANAVMKVLTVFAGLMLPLTVIAGIYGMNLPIWPSGDDPLSFWSVLGAMALLEGCLLAYFRSKKWV